MTPPHFTLRSRKPLLIILAALLTCLLPITAFALRGSAVEALTQASPLHPDFPLLDENGEHVLESGGAVSTMQTCGACHDTEFIEEHSFHASQGLLDLVGPGELEGSRAWEISPGLFGRWMPLAYRYLTPAGDELLDLGTAGWIEVYGPRHVGGGPSVYAQDGVTRLDQLPIEPGDPQTHMLDPETSEWITWDWTESGVVEMNCFLCHTAVPDNAARVEALHEGDFRWASTATLLGTEIVFKVGDNYRWNPGSFDDAGNVTQDVLAIQDPTDDNCGFCHGLVQDNLTEPITITGCSPERLRTVTTGQIISPQRLSDTGMNLADKETLTRPWDIHADRLLECTDCHYSLNNPVYFLEPETERPEHLLFDPRRLELGEYLYQPLHQFARGETAQNTVAPQLRGTMRRCDSCHSMENTHDWLPYKERHVEAISCETCHIPKMYSNALMQYDWTVLTADGTGVNYCRGIEGDSLGPDTLITGFEPVLLPKETIDGEVQLAPYNLVTTFYWVQGDPVRPVRMLELEAAWMEDGVYADEVLALFDDNGDGGLSKDELALDTPEKTDLIAGRLTALGVENPRIVGEIQPYSINHTVAGEEWAIRECNTCHSEESRIVSTTQLTTFLPGGSIPVLVGNSNTMFDDDDLETRGGALYYQPATEDQGLYVFGLDRVSWVDRIGALAFITVLLGVAAHGGLRFLSATQNKPEEEDLREVYMYGVYERLWHWLQTFAIVALLFTGLIIHKPELFGFLSFRGLVLVHNILAGVLVVNAVLALFYHLASGEIRQYLPRPVGFFDQAITQARYYLRGIFRGEDHPFVKTPQAKLNPLQKITYFGILNVLLPLQVLTGLLMWGAQTWPEVTERLGGLPFLAPFHSLIAWLFGTFIVLHVYLTTTGPTPLANIRAMMLGWEPVEDQSLQQEIAP